MKEIADVSFYQDDDETPQGIDFDKMKLQSDAVIIRAGQNTWIDSDFKTNWQAAKDAGLMRGSYWYYDSRSEPEAQARLWAQALDGDFGELPLFIDLEESYGGAHSGWNKWWGFVKYVKIYMPEKADHLMIYTGYYYWLEHTETMPQETKDFFGALPLWIARYKATEPLIPSTWDKAMLWQYTSTGDGTLWGVESLDIDLNRFLGDEADWQWFTGFTIIDPPPPDPTPDPDPPAPIDGVYRMDGKITITNGRVTGFTSDFQGFTPENPPPETEKTEHTLYPKPEQFLRCHRTPNTDSTAANKIQFYPLHGSTVYTAPLLEYRNHAGNLVLNWTTLAEEANARAVWARIYIQPVKKNNFTGANYRMLWPDWDTGGKEWDLYGCYILLEDLKAISTPPVTVPDPDPDPEYPPYDPDFDANPPADPDYITPEDWVRWMPEPVQVPHDGYEWVQVNNDTEARFRYAVPQTVSLLVPKEDNEWKDKELWMPFSEEWQWVIWRWTQLDSPQRSHNYHLWAFERLFEDHKAFTDLNNYEGFTNYVLARFIDPVKFNLALNEPFKAKISLTTGGNGLRGYRNGAQFVAEAFDIHNPPADPDAAYLERWRCHNATQITTVRLEDGRMKTVNFPMGRNALKENGTWEKTRTSWPLIGARNSEIAIAWDKVSSVKNGSSYNIVNLDR